MNNITDIVKLLHSMKEDAVPSDAFKNNARIRILNTVTTPHPLRMSWYRRPRILGYTFGTAIATVVLSVGTVYAAQSSLPNTTLYPVKVLSEKVALTLSPTESLKTNVAATIISRRVTEAEDAQKQGDAHALEDSITRLDNDVSSIQQRKDVSQHRIEEELSKHREFMNSIHKKDGESEREDERTSSESETGTPAVTQTPKDYPSPTPTITQPENKLPNVEGVTTNHKED